MEPLPTDVSRLIERRLARTRQLIQNSDVVHVSFPKSGKTWVRWFLQAYYEAADGVPFELGSSRIAGRSLPSVVFTEDFFNVYADVPVEPRVLFQDLLDDKRVIVLVRDPRDIVVSYYHWARARLIDDPARPRPFLDVSSLNRFIRSDVYGIERIAKYLGLLMDYAESRSADTMLVSYERLHDNRWAEFATLVQFITSDTSSDALTEALERASFEAMQRREVEISQGGDAANYRRVGVEDWDGDFNSLKVRRGEVGGFRAEMGLRSRIQVLASRPVRKVVRRLDQPLW